jgi:hypothetical protein
VGLRQRPGTVDVEHQIDVGTGFFACRADPEDLDLMKLERIESASITCRTLVGTREKTALRSSSP